jgi:hypothetical protein
VRALGQSDFCNAKYAPGFCKAIEGYFTKKVLAHVHPGNDLIAIFSGDENNSTFPLLLQV